LYYVRVEGVSFLPSPSFPPTYVIGSVTLAFKRRSRYVVLFVCSAQARLRVFFEQYTFILTFCGNTPGLHVKPRSAPQLSVTNYHKGTQMSESN
jgi:hypothetical protein